MKLENQVVSLQLAQQLKALGVRQDSFWKTCSCHERIIQSSAVYDHENCFSAFTVAELGELLPQFEGMKLVSCPYRGKWIAFYEAHSVHENDIRTKLATTEADARAQLLIHLIKNNLWKP